jgi:GNAT superfamily N-acetyltransferase
LNQITVKRVFILYSQGTERGTHILIAYRKADIKDIDALIDVRIDFMKEVMDIKDDLKDIELRKSLFHYFSDLIPKDEFIAWLAICDDKIIGTSGLSFYKRPPSYKNLDGKVAYIMNMYTLPSYREKGVAKVFILKYFRGSKSKGVLLF